MQLSSDSIERQLDQLTKIKQVGQPMKNLTTQHIPNTTSPDNNKNQKTKQ
ncbi:MAG: hypothetical protein LBQ66_12370 [Planctomycetaceae bacterium]|jgi:hypothetical protein|nr:hypothetical protein [Planctomycetaceae bacterium]